MNHSRAADALHDFSESAAQHLLPPHQRQGQLGAAGFVNVALEDVRAPMDFGPTPERAMQYLSSQHAGSLADLDPEARDRALEAPRVSVQAHHDGSAVRYDSAAWLVTAQARR